MIVSVNAIETLLIEVKRGVTAAQVREAVEAEITGAVVEQIIPIDRNRRQAAIGVGIMPTYDNKEGPWVPSDNILYIVTYRKDISKQFRDTIRKMEKAAKEREAERVRKEEETKEATRKQKVEDLKAKLKELGEEIVEVPIGE
jgi:hypothetical protein